MKKLYFSAIAMVLGLSAASAQILTQSNHAPLIGEVRVTRQCDSTAINPGPGGVGVVWSFTNMAIHTPTVSSTVTAVPSTSASAFPSASIAITPDGSNNSFYSVATSTAGTMYNYWGGNFVVQSYNIILDYTQPAVLAVYPVGYNSTNSVTAAGTLSLSSLTGNFSGVASYTADGTGTLQLPITGTTTIKTFTNVLRVKTLQVLNFTALVTGTLTQQTYDYYATSQSKAPILSITETTVHTSSSSDQTQTVVTVNSAYASMGVNEVNKEVAGLSVYPNPASGSVNISFINEAAEPAWCEIGNALGQTIRKADLGNDKGSVKQRINIEGLGTGIYFLKVHVGDKTGLEKITVQ